VKDGNVIMLPRGTHRYLADFDWLLLVVVLALAAFGILEISSAEPVAGLWRRQAFGVLLGVGLLFLVTFVDYRRILGIAPVIYVGGTILLILVLTPLGKVVNGNRNWLYFGPIGMQPSEFAKLSTILLLAISLAKLPAGPIRLASLFKPVLIWAIPTGLVLLGNDAGSALSFFSFLIVMLFVRGIPWRWVATGLGGLILLLSFSIPVLKQCKGYKCERIRAVYWPELAEKRFRYQNDQAEIAVGSGGIFGKGLRGSTQGALGFVPEVHNDFIYAVTSEEWGFVGAFLTLTAYLFIVMRILQIARQARDREATYLVTGIAGLLLYHMTVNIGMVLRFLPVMGIPLPLMSAGSSSAVATLIGLGLVLSVRLNRFVN
jgi:rod shape determining protein RodA